MRWFLFNLQGRGEECSWDQVNVFWICPSRWYLTLFLQANTSCILLCIEGNTMQVGKIILADNTCLEGSLYLYFLLPSWLKTGEKRSLWEPMWFWNAGYLKWARFYTNKTIFLVYLSSALRFSKKVKPTRDFSWNLMFLLLFLLPT